MHKTLNYFFWISKLTSCKCLYFLCCHIVWEKLTLPYRYDEGTKECTLHKVTQTNIGNGTTKSHIFGIRAGKCMISYPSMRFNETMAEEFCARQGSGGKLAELRTPAEMLALQDTLLNWKGKPWKIKVNSLYVVRNCYLILLHCFILQLSKLVSAWSCIPPTPLTGSATGNQLAWSLPLT